MISHGNLVHSLLQFVVIGTEMAKVYTVNYVSNVISLDPNRIFLLASSMAHTRGFPSLTCFSSLASYLWPTRILFPPVSLPDHSRAPTAVGCGPRPPDHTKVCNNLP